MNTLITALILTALTLTAIIVAPLFPQAAPSFNDSKLIWKGSDVGVHLQLRRDTRKTKF
jgi:hypothetical protein